MELPRRLTTALHTLNAAVDLLESVAERCMQADATRIAIEKELTALRSEHDGLVERRRDDDARLHGLMQANGEVGARLDRIAGALRALARDREPPQVPDGESD